jgi:hypothetical protein
VGNEAGTVPEINSQGNAWRLLLCIILHPMIAPEKCDLMPQEPARAEGSARRAVLISRVVLKLRQGTMPRQ